MGQSSPRKPVPQRPAPHPGLSSHHGAPPPSGPTAATPQDTQGSPEPDADGRSGQEGNHRVCERTCPASAGKGGVWVVFVVLPQACHFRLSKLWKQQLNRSERSRAPQPAEGFSSEEEKDINLLADTWKLVYLIMKSALMPRAPAR